MEANTLKMPFYSQFSLKACEFHVKGALDPRRLYYIIIRTYIVIRRYIILLLLK